MKSSFFQYSPDQHSIIYFRMQHADCASISVSVIVIGVCGVLQSAHTLTHTRIYRHLPISCILNVVVMYMTHVCDGILECYSEMCFL